MITAYGFKNYKGFDDGIIELKPLTIFLGPNNAGKSSALHLPLILSQTIAALNTSTGSTYSKTIDLNGIFISAGRRKHLIKQSKDNSVSFCVRFTDNRLLRELKSRFMDNFISEIYDHITINISRIYNYKESTDIESIVKRLNTIESSRELNAKELMSIIDLLRNELNAISTKESADSSKAIHTYRRLQNLKSKEDYECSYSFLRALSSLKSSIFTIEYRLQLLSDESLHISAITMYNGKTKFLKVEINDSKAISLKIESDIWDSNILSKNLIKHTANSLDQSANIFNCVKTSPWSSENDTMISDIILNVISRIVDKCRKNLDPNQISYIGPLREIPRRYFFSDNNDPRISYFLSNQIDILKNDKDVSNKINGWLSRLGTNIEVSSLDEGIDRIEANRHNNKYVKLDLTDIGIGVSQFLPIMISGYASETNTIHIVEQPELHLHPDFQAMSVDIFLDMMRDSHKGTVLKQFVIETHSEYFLRRLQLRMLEGIIDIDNVAVYLFYDTDKGTRVERQKISNYADFNWPKNLLEDTVRDTLKISKLRAALTHKED